MKISKLSATIGVFAVCVSFASVHAQDNSAQAAARAALMKQMDQVQAPTAAPSTPVAPVAPAAPAVVVTPNPSMEAAQPVIIVTADANTEAQNRARAALLQKMNATATAAQQPTTPGVPGRIAIIAPALPISATKEQRLQALLMQYRADQITPQQYQTQRAAILAEP